MLQNVFAEFPNSISNEKNEQLSSMQKSRNF